MTLPSEGATAKLSSPTNRKKPMMIGPAMKKSMCRWAVKRGRSGDAVVTGGATATLVAVAVTGEPGACADMLLDGRADAGIHWVPVHQS